MEVNSSILWTALALMLLFEGALYAVFPEAMQRMMRNMLDMPPDTLRRIGMAVAFVGFMLVYFLHR